MYILVKCYIKWLEKLLGVVNYSQFYTIISTSKSGLLSVIVSDKNSLMHLFAPFYDINSPSRFRGGLKQNIKPDLNKNELQSFLVVPSSSRLTLSGETKSSNILAKTIFLQSGKKSFWHNWKKRGFLFLMRKLRLLIDILGFSMKLIE